jgi:hypothetical protein
MQLVILAGGQDPRLRNRLGSLSKPLADAGADLDERFLVMYRETILTVDPDRFTSAHLNSAFHLYPHDPDSHGKPQFLPVHCDYQSARDSRNIHNKLEVIVGRLNIDPSRSWFIGDFPDPPDHVLSDLEFAVKFIHISRESL